MMANAEKWIRIEPHAQTTDLGLGLAAQIADPLWLILRQWQLGELTGDDAGSPVAVDLHASTSRFSTYQADAEERAGRQPSSIKNYDPHLPLEAQIERESLLQSESASWSARVQTGRALRRHLSDGFAEVADRLATAFPFTATVPDSAPLDGIDRRFSDLLTGSSKLIDGIKVLHAAELPAESTNGFDRAELEQRLQAWRQEIEEDWGPLTAPASPSEAWVKDRFEYAFSIGAAPLTPGEAELVFRAREYDGTGVSWYSLDLDTTPGSSLGAGEHPPESLTQTTLPTQLSYRGMPADRFWEFEDSAVQIGRVTAGPTDLARLLAIDYAVVFSPDWFLVPLDLPVGGVSRIDWVIVRDAFGEATLVGTSAQQSTDLVGRQFQPSSLDGAEGDHPFLVVLPSAMSSIVSPAREEVALQRDEAANLAWAIEKCILSQTGRGIPTPWTRTEFEPPQPTSPDYDVAWRLATPVAKSWTPLVSPPSGDGQILRKAKLLVTATGELTRARGMIMRDVDKDIRDEEITSAGVQVRLIEQMARGTDGSTHVWRGREKRPWRGEVSSGLRYDSTTKPSTRPEG